MFKEQELILAQELAGLAIWEWVVEKDELRWLPGSTALFGCALDELRGKSDTLAHIVPEDRDAVNKARDEAVRTGGEYNAEYRVIWPNGEIRWIRASGRVAVDPGHGKILIGVSQDVTETKRREEKLRAQARLLDLAYEPILVRDKADKITFWNAGAERLYGYGRQEAVGRTSHELLQTEFPTAFADIQRKLDDVGFWQGELVHRAQDGHRLHVESRWQTFSADGSRFTLESNFDLSEQQALQALRSWEERMLLLGQMAHEINNPLSVALSATHLLKLDCTDGNREYLAMLEDAIMRIADFIRRSGEVHRRVVTVKPQRRTA